MKVQIGRRVGGGLGRTPRSTLLSTNLTCQQEKTEKMTLNEGPQPKHADKSSPTNVLLQKLANRNCLEYLR